MTDNAFRGRSELGQRLSLRRAAAMADGLDDFVSRLRLTPAGVARSVADDVQKPAANLSKHQLDPRQATTLDQRTKITPEEALGEALVGTDPAKLLELYTTEEFPQNSAVWRDAVNKPLSARYVQDIFGIGWMEYWARQALGALLSPITYYRSR